MNLSYELQFEPLMYLSYPEIINYCNTNTWARSICQDEGFWKTKYEYDFGQTPVLSPTVRSWKKMCENAYKIQLQFHSFFSVGKRNYAIIDNLGQLYIGKSHLLPLVRNDEIPQKIPFDEKIIHVSSNDKDTFGITTLNGNAYILEANNYGNLIKIQTPNNKKVIKLEVFYAVKFSDRLLIMILEDQSIYYTIGTNELPKQLKFPDEIAATVMANDIICHNQTVVIPLRTEFNTQIFISNMTSNHIYVFDADVTGYVLTYTKTVRLPVIAKKISYSHQYKSYYMILSPDGEVYIQMEEDGKYEKLPIQEKVKSISQDLVNHLVTESGKLYIWNGNREAQSRLYLLSLPLPESKYPNNTYSRSIMPVMPIMPVLTKPVSPPVKLVPKYPVEINLSDGSNVSWPAPELPLKIISARFFANVNSTFTQSYLGLAVTKDGLILTWAFRFKLVYEMPEKYRMHIPLRCQPYKEYISAGRIPEFNMPFQM